MKIEDVSGPFTRIYYEDFNLNSFEQVKQYLLSQGWKPTKYTDKGSPQLTEDSLASIKGDVAQLIGRRSILMHRKRMLKNTTKLGEEKGWLNSLRKDGRLTAGGIPQGTPTGRYRHTLIVNVPKANDNVVYGKELRALFIPRDGWVFVGCDAAALEARIEAHYCYPFPGGVEYANDLIDGDLHTKNAEKIGCSRNEAKTAKYSLTFGAEPPKLAEQLGASLYRAKKIHKEFWKNSKALAAFKESLLKTWKSRGGARGGFLRGLDGRKLFVRSPHSAVNLMFQSAGAIVCKKATCILSDRVVELDIRCNQVLHSHDEFQYECHPDDVGTLKQEAVAAFVKAGEFFNLNVPMAGEAKSGANWKETH